MEQTLEMKMKPNWEQELASLKGFKAILDVNTLQDFSCKAWNGKEFENFTIHKKDDNAESKQKRLEELFWQNFDNTLAKSEIEQTFFEYRGLTIKGVSNFTKKCRNNYNFERKSAKYYLPKSRIFRDFTKRQ